MRTAIRDNRGKRIMELLKLKNAWMSCGPTVEEMTEAEISKALLEEVEAGGPTIMSLLKRASLIPY